MKELEIYEVEKLIKETNLSSMFALPYFVRVLAIQRPTSFLQIETANNEFLVPIILDSFEFRSHRVYNYVLSLSPPQPLGKEPVLSQDIRSCLEKLEKFTRNAYGCRELSIIQYPHDSQELKNLSLPADWNIMDKGQDLLLDLSVDLPTLYYNMAKRHRYVLRKITGLNNENIIEITPEKLIDAGYRLEIGTNMRNLRDFYSLWMITFEKMQKQLSKERIDRVAESFKFENYARSIETLSPKGLCEIFLLYKEDIPLCGAVLYVSNNFLRVKRGYWSAGSATQEAKRLGAPLLLQWMIIKWLRKGHYLKYFLGGLDPENSQSGPTLFKMGFGGQIIKGKHITHRAAPLQQMYQLGRVMYTLMPMKGKILSLIGDR